jgi:hypothetical protein
MDDSSKRYRLRIDDVVVGHMKVIHAIVFYSPDAYAWSGNEIDFLQKDEFTGFFDKNRIALYSEDIIQLSTHPQKYFILHFDSALNTFHIVDTEEMLILDDDFFEILSNSTQVTRVSHTFKNV